MHIGQKCTVLKSKIARKVTIGGIHHVEEHMSLCVSVKNESAFIRVCISLITKEVLCSEKTSILLDDDFGYDIFHATIFGAGSRGGKCA